MMEAVSTSETSATSASLHETIRRSIPEKSDLQKRTRLRNANKLKPRANSYLIKYI
jgi:hypothetical protein